MKKHLLLALLLGAGGASHAQYLAASDPLLSANNYLGLAQAGSRMVAVGERGHILFSDDEGQRWRQAQSPTSALLTAVCFLDANHGWAVGHDAVVLHTEDGGETWQQQYADVFTTPDYDAFDDEDFYDDYDMDDLYSMDDIYADPYEDYDDEGGFGDDSGGSSGMLEVADAPLLGVHCGSGDRVIAVGGFGYYLESRDRGASWEKRTDLLANREGAHLYSISGDKATAVRYIAGERGAMFRSDDRGDSWRRLPAPSAGTFFGLKVLNDQQVLAYGLQGQIWRSRDGGESWQSLQSGISRGINDAAVLADGSLLLVSNAGGLLTLMPGEQHVTLRFLSDRQSISAVLPRAAGGAILAGQGGLRLLETID